MSVNTHKPVLTGWLTKQGGSRGGRKNWKIRFFELSEKHLLYFKNKKSLDHPLGEFVCDDLTAVAVTNSTIKDAYMFDLIYPTRTVRVYANAEVDRKNWIDAINQPSEYSGPSSTAAERPTRARTIIRRPGSSHKRSSSEGARQRARTLTLPQRISTGGAAKCPVCGKTAYPMESITCDGVTYHKRCFRCKECNSKLSVGGYAMIHGDAYCKPHFKQLFQKHGGKYDRAFGSIFTNSSDPLAKVIKKASTDVAQHGNGVANDAPAVAEFSDDDSDGLSEGEVESRDRLAVIRKSLGQLAISSSDKTKLEEAAKSKSPESHVREECIPETCSCGVTRVMEDAVTKKPAAFCYHCGSKYDIAVPTTEESAI